MDGNSHNAKRKSSNGRPQTNQWRHSGFTLSDALAILEVICKRDGVVALCVLYLT